MTNLSTEWLPGMTGPYRERTRSVCQNQRELRVAFNISHPSTVLQRRVKSPTNLWGICVVKHAENHPGHGVLGVRHVAWRGEGGQVVLQGLAENAVEGDVRTEDVTLLPAVFLQLLNLSPKAVQVLKQSWGGDSFKLPYKSQETVNFLKKFKLSICAAAKHLDTVTHQHPIKTQICPSSNQTALS